MSVLSDLMFLLSVYVVIQAHEKCGFELNTVYRFKMTIAFFIAALLKTYCSLITQTNRFWDITFVR